jgi:hypothetical protein
MAITINGKSATVYSFEMYRISQSFKAVGAVYLMLKHDPQIGKPNWYRYIYVGETGDLSTRFSNHHKQACFDENGVDWIGIHLDGNEKSRKSKEADILAANILPCND